MKVRGGQWAAGRSRQPQADNRQRGSVLILAIVIAAVLAMLATAFIITARVEHKAATNALRGAQAEAACRAGLAAAIARIEMCRKLEQVSASVYGLDTPGSWHEYFYSNNTGSPDYCQDLCLDASTGKRWVEHYDSTFTKPEMKAKKWPMPIAEGSDPAAALKRQKGFTAEYYVAVADLDGKLHSNPKFIDNSFADADRDAKTLDMVNALGLTADPARTTLTNDDAANWSFGQLRAKLVAAGVAQAEWNDAERVFTVYPRVTAPIPLVAKSIKCADSQVNVNTARKEVLKAIVLNVPDFTANIADAVADKLTDKSKRPFATRKDMEMALVELGDASITNLPAGYAIKPGGVLDEKKLNDLLNSLAGDNSAAIDASDLDDDVPATPGLYHHDFNGDSRCDKDLDYTSDSPTATWGTEVKFTSRFYHIYVLARTLSGDSPPRVTAERRLHAVYDADPSSRRVLWLRWNFAAKANTSD